MKVSHLGTVCLVLVILGAEVRRLVLAGKLSGDGFVVEVHSYVTAVCVTAFLILIGKLVLRALGVRPIGSWPLAPDDHGVRRGRMSFRVPMAIACIALAALFLTPMILVLAGSRFSFSVLLFVLVMGGFGVWLAYGAIYILLYSFAYSEQHVTTLGLDLRAYSHRWVDILSIGDGHECKLIMFRKSGKARVPDWCQGRAELLEFAESKLNDARTS